jgi:hypothetical protein
MIVLKPVALAAGFFVLTLDNKVLGASRVAAYNRFPAMHRQRIKIA